MSNGFLTGTIQFGGCDRKTPNCLPIMPDWNYTERLSPAERNPDGKRNRKHNLNDTFPRKTQFIKEVMMSHEAPT